MSIPPNDMPKTILIAEDYADVRRMMKIMVEKDGYVVIEAADGYEAFEKAREFAPDLILMDLAMPVMDGFQAVQAIRTVDDLASTPIIAITAYGRTHGTRAIEVGCNAVVDKPVNISGIRRILKQHLSQ